MRRLLLAYPLIWGGVISALLVVPVVGGGIMLYGAWLYVGTVIAVMTFALDRLLRVVFARWAPPGAIVLVPLVAAAAGALAGWWAATYTMGGPV